MTITTYSRKDALQRGISRNAEIFDLPYTEINTGNGWTAEFETSTDAQRKAVEAAGFTFKAVAATKATEGKTLDQKAMLASLSIKGWSGRIVDLAATDDVLTRNQAQEGWGKFSKRLVSKEAIKAIKAAEAAARKAHKELTLPWDEKGFRILPAAAWQEYSKQIGDAKIEWETAVSELLKNYDEVRDEGRAALGGLFNPDDYPTADELHEKYSFEPEVKALDIKGDFRVQLGAGELERLQASIQSTTEARLSHAMSDLYRRLHDVVAHMAERLRAYKVDEDGKKHNPFRDATLQNVQDIVDLMPALNLTNDPALDALAQHVQKTLLAADAKSLREDPNTREATAKAADEIANAMQGMM